MVLRIISTFIASLTFSLLFSAPKKELVFCGMTGAFGWFMYEVISLNTDSSILPTFAATLVASFVSRFLAFRRRNPITLYLIAGIIPLVPGAAIYYTMYNILTSNVDLAVQYGTNTVKTSGVISLGIAIILAFPPQLFRKIAFADKV